MRLPTVQTVERKITVVGSALRCCLRLLTPATIFFALLTLFFKCFAEWLPLPYSATHFYSRRYIAVEESANLTLELALLTLLVCIVAALTTLDDRVRDQRPLYWHVVIAMLVPFAHIYFVPAFDY